MSFIFVQKQIKPHNCSGDACTKCVAHYIDPDSITLNWSLMIKLIIISILLVFTIPLLNGCVLGPLKSTKLYENRQCNHQIPDAGGPWWWYNRQIEMDACK